MSKKIKVESRLLENFKIENNAWGHSFIVDQPKESGGAGAGPSPLQLFLASLSSCVITMAQYGAKERNIRIDAMNVTAEGEMSSDSRIGFDNITVTVDLDANVPEKQKFAEEVEGTCPVVDNIKNPTIIKLIIR